MKGAFQRVVSVALRGGVAGIRVPVTFRFGDSSGSVSEKYCLTVEPVPGTGPGATPRTLSCVNAEYGSVEERTFSLVPGWRYGVRLAHAGTNIEGDGGPDYDNRYGRNACAIERNVRYVYFKKVIKGIYIKKNVKKENW